MYRLGSSPEGLLVDEVSFGYNAYSILKTGKDEHGKSFPVIFEAFGDQKLPGLVYSTVPFIQLFGLSAVAVRMPSAIAGSILILVSYFLARAIHVRKATAVVLSAVVAWSPWTIILSRFGYESNLALLIWSTSLIFLIQSITKKKITSLIVFVSLLIFSWYFYIAYRVVGMLFLLAFGLFLLLQKRYRELAVMGIVGCILMAPILPTLFSSQGTARFTQIGILHDRGIGAQSLESQNYCFFHFSSRFCRILWNEPFIIGKALVERAVTFISPSYLFLEGDRYLPYLHDGRYGLFSLVLLPFFYYGIMHPPKQKKIVFLIYGGLLISILPMILAGDPQKVRATPSFPFLLLLMGIGIEQASTIFRKYSTHMYAILIGGIFVYGIHFFISYLTIHLDKYDFAVNTHVTKLFKYLRDTHPQDEIQIVHAFSDPVMYYAYFFQIDPTRYQTTVVWNDQESSGFKHARALQRFSVGQDAFMKKACVVYVTDQPQDSSEFLEHTITSTNGVDTLFRIYQVVPPEGCPNPQHEYSQTSN
ncbi:MAG: hypothetical protein UX04_C0001G0053 [Microgenomates group bacterium GW2011_GWF2_45_18]|nr:MAG: hypothetical protein UX04_C0001G0053 [Microgenomates group bacterium GW2011_GWF2_45_18]